MSEISKTKVIVLAKDGDACPFCKLTNYPHVHITKAGIAEALDIAHAYADAHAAPDIALISRALIALDDERKELHRQIRQASNNQSLV